MTDAEVAERLNVIRERLDKAPYRDATGMHCSRGSDDSVVMITGYSLEQRRPALDEQQFTDDDLMFMLHAPDDVAFLLTTIAELVVAVADLTEERDDAIVELSGYEQERAECDGI